MSGPPLGDWQTNCRTLQERGHYLLESGLWSDCTFIVGMELNSQVFECHKLFLAKASPVFQAMFYGGIPEKNPISILDVQPDAFKALLEYIYEDAINVTSFDQACELCYAAKKYMLPFLVEECTKYLWADLKVQNVCRAYAFAKLFEEPKLMGKCLMIIRDETQEILQDESFYDVEIDTLSTILDQEFLTIDSELVLFQALTCLASKQTNKCTGANVKVPRLDDTVASTSAAADESSSVVSTESSSSSSSSQSPSVRDCLLKIRFLTLTPQQFAEGPATSSLLTQNEKFAILVNISSPQTNVSMPPGFSQSVVARRRHSDNRLEYSSELQEFTLLFGGTGGERVILQGRDFCCEDISVKQICIRSLIRQTEFMNPGVSDCMLAFQCDRNVCVYGIQVPAQIKRGDDGDSYPYLSYGELLYAHLLDGDGARLTYTHFTSRVQYFSVMDISFNRPVFIQKNKTYKVGVVLNKSGWYPIGTYPSFTAANGAIFSFPPQNSNESRDGLMRSIIFSCNTRLADTGFHT